MMTTTQHTANCTALRKKNIMESYSVMSLRGCSMPKISSTAVLLLNGQEIANVIQLNPYPIGVGI